MSSKPDPSGGKQQKGLTVDTSHGDILPTDEALALGSSSSSSSFGRLALAQRASKESGKNQPIEPIEAQEERLAEANAFIERLGFVWGGPG